MILNKYSIIIEGVNIHISSNGHLERVGFYTTRWVEASNQHAATTIALRLVDQELLSLGLLRDTSNLPILKVEEVHKIDSFDGLNAPGKGFSFFSDPIPS